MRILAVNHGQPIYLFPNGRIFFVGRAMIDGDGSGGNVWNEPVPPWQPDTTYHFQGKALNPNTTNFIAVPPVIITSVDPVVLGCHVRIRNMQNDRRTTALVGDVAPHDGIGEMSPACARDLVIHDSPITGGMETFDLLYEIFPGLPASCNNRTWPLQPYGS